MTKNKKLRAAGTELAEMLNVGREGMKAKSAVAVAVEAFEDAGTAAQAKRKSSQKSVSIQGA